MLPEVILISRPQINWPTYLSAAKSALGRNITDQIDSAKITPDGIPAYVATIGAIKDPQKSAQSIIADPGQLLEHCFYGFLVASYEIAIYELAEITNLSISSISTQNRQLRLAVVSGSLDKWREAIINSSGDCDHELRLLMNKFLLAFEQEGIGCIWSQYSKVYQIDRSFKLTEKK